MSLSFGIDLIQLALPPSFLPAFLGPKRQRRQAPVRPSLQMVRLSLVSDMQYCQWRRVAWSWREDDLVYVYGVVCHVWIGGEEQPKLLSDPKRLGVTPLQLVQVGGGTQVDVGSELVTIQVDGFLFWRAAFSRHQSTTAQRSAATSATMITLARNMTIAVSAFFIF